MIVSAVVVSHGHARELEALVPLLEPQVDEVVLVANTPGSVPTVLPQSVRVLENARPHRLAVNVNLGVAATTGEWVLFSNPDVVPAPDAVGVLHGFATTHPRCGIAGPRTVWPDGRWQPTRRSFPTVSGTLVRRTPLRRIFPPLERQTAHYHLDEDVDRPLAADCRSSSCAARCSSSSAGTTRAIATTSRTSTSATAQCARAGSAGTSPPRA